MQGRADEGSLYLLERQFQYNDSIKIIRKQVEEYEELVKKQAQRIERTRQDGEEAEKIKNEAKRLKN
jgi:hypothetical protein